MQRMVSDELGNVRRDTNESWKERLLQILEGYKPEDICNVDETGCFWKALQNQGLGQRKVECESGKKEENRLTIAFFVNTAGEPEPLTVVIWKSQTPLFQRCKKGPFTQKIMCVDVHCKGVNKVRRRIHRLYT